jgi:hypothetical protein
MNCAAVCLQHWLDRHYNKTKENSVPAKKVKIGYPNRRRTQLYSRNTGRFVQVISKGKIVAKGQDGDKYGKLY